MMKVYNTIFIYLFVCFSLKAQDIHFSQFFATPILINPANAGLENDLDIGLIYRTQWKAIAKPFTSYGISVSGIAGKRNKKGNLGLGLDCYYDKSGDASFAILQSGFNMAYSVKLNKYNFLSAGIKLNFNQRSINSSSFQWGQQYDGKSYNGSLASGEQLNNLQAVTFFDVASGLNYRFKKGDKTMSSNTLRIFDIGISAFHINRANVSLYSNQLHKLPTRIMFYFMGNIGLENTNVAILPKAYYQLQGTQQELVAGFLVSIKPVNESKVTGFVTSNIFNIGLLYRAKDAFIPVIQYEIKSYVIGLSYDINVSKLTSASNARGAFEITLRYINHNTSLRKGKHVRYGTNKLF